MIIKTKKTVSSLTAKKYNFKDETSVDMTEETVKITSAQARNNLTELLDKINNSNLHNEIQTVVSAGKETW